MDVGAGSGFFGIELVRDRPEIKLICVDPNYSDKEIRDDGRISFVRESHNVEADLYIFADVLEHVENDELAVFEMKRVAKSKGLLLITVPAYMDLWSHHDVINHHFRRYKSEQIKNLFNLEINGKEVFSSYFNFFLFIPIYLIRKVSNLLNSGKNRSGSGSDFEAFKPGILNQALNYLMGSEKLFINNNIRLPFGVSFLYSWKKN